MKQEIVRCLVCPLLFDINICRGKQSWKSVMFTGAKHYNHYHNKTGVRFGMGKLIRKKTSTNNKTTNHLAVVLICPWSKKLLFHWLSVNDFCLQLMPCSFWLFLCSLSGKWLCRLVFCIALNLYLVCFKLKTDLTECIERSGVPLLMQQAVRKLQSAQVGTFH